MKYLDLAIVNEQIKTIDVKGKQYSEVAQRINAFRKRTHYVINIAKSKQVDVYDQVMLNWNKFLDYVWENI